MNFLQNLMARHQTETTQSQAAISGVAAASGLIVQPRPKLRFEGGSEPLMQAPDNSQTGFSDSLTPQVDSTYHRPQMTSAFTEFGIRPHSEMPDERQSTRPQHSAGISPDTLLGMLNGPQNNQQDHNMVNESGYKNSGVHVAMDTIGETLEGIGRLANTSRVQREASLVQPTRQLSNKLDSQLDFQSHKPQGWQSGAENSVTELTQNSAQSGPQQGDQQRAQHSSYQNKQHSAQHAWGADSAASPSSPSNSGSLLAPDWLNQIQADLQDRWQALNQKAQAEPVINVTIGRVEVRAVQTDSPPARKRSTLPSGVMTLDSYLKQRNRKGGV